MTTVQGSVGGGQAITLNPKPLRMPDGKHLHNVRRAICHCRPQNAETYSALVKELTFKVT